MSGDGELAPTDSGPKSKSAEPTWRVVVDVAWRIVLVTAGIPAVWILRRYEIIDLTAWQAAGISIVLFLIAVGEYTLPALWPW
ncbi:hypothetical protein [Mycobacteroides abscessus]|uniref:hypothetical protein n=1 Tax=Mycobacteroides abscessus TaxID=36809 RepID=UPI000C267A79|nr:hypothetical protein [Mycobacteroides abscessus]